MSSVFYSRIWRCIYTFGSDVADDVKTQIGRQQLDVAIFPHFVVQSGPDFCSESLLLISLFVSVRSAYSQLHRHNMSNAIIFSEMMMYAMMGGMGLHVMFHIKLNAETSKLSSGAELIPDILLLSCSLAHLS